MNADRKEKYDQLKQDVYGLEAHFGAATDNIRPFSGETLVCRMRPGEGSSHNS
jgi:hypothetical protein